MFRKAKPPKKEEKSGLLTHEQLLARAGSDPDAYSLFVAQIPQFFRFEGSDKEEVQWRLLSFSLYLGVAFRTKVSDFSDYISEAMPEDSMRRALSDCKRIQKAVANGPTGPGELWRRAVDALYEPLRASDPDTVGPEADMARSFGRLPYAGFSPGFVLGLNDSSVAQRLFDDALVERGGAGASDPESYLFFMISVTHVLLKQLMDRAENELGQRLAKDPDEVHTLLSDKDRWPTLAREELRVFVFAAIFWYGVKNDESWVPALTQLYSHYQSRFHVNDRLRLLQGVEPFVQDRGCSINALLPFLFEDASHTVIASAALQFAIYHPLREGDPLTGPKFLMEYFRKGWSKEPAAIFGGLLQLGDRRVLRLLEAHREELTDDQIAAVARLYSRLPHVAAVEFFLDWMEQTDDERQPTRFAHLCAALDRIAEDALTPKGETEPLVSEVERVFPVPPEEGAEAIRFLRRYKISEYARMIEPRLRALAAKEHGERLIPLVMKTWGLSYP